MLSAINGTNDGVKSISPHSVHLSGPSAPLPSREYLRVIAYSTTRANVSRPSSPKTNHSDGPIARGNNNNRNSNSTSNSISRAARRGGPDVCDGAAAVPERHDFALHMRSARLCRLLETVLDAADLCLDAEELSLGTAAEEEENNNNNHNNHNHHHHNHHHNHTNTYHNHSDPQPMRHPAAAHALPPVVLPHATRRGCEAVFCYLDMITTRMPTALGKPLRAPLEELVQPWEMHFLLWHCLDDATREALWGRRGKALGEEVPTTASAFAPGGNYYRAILAHAPQSLGLLLEVAMISDFLLVEPLRQLTCAFVASLALNASSGAELLQLCGQSRAMTEVELEPLYAQMPFLRPDDASEH